MSSYIGKISINHGAQILIGSTLYGVCNTAPNISAKKVIFKEQSDTVSDGYYDAGKFINSNYDQLLQGTTIHVKFVQGNTITSNLTLQVGTILTAQDIVGDCTCPAGAVLSFTLDENEKWVVNDNVDNDTTYSFAEGSTNGTFTVTPIGGSAQTVSVHGLGDSAYKGIITNIGSNSSSDAVPTTQAVVSYVQDMTGGLAGLSGAMHFRGKVTDPNVTITDGGHEMPHINGYDYENGSAKANFTPESGDVVLFEQQEYVWTGTVWELLGDESSYALNSNTDYITEVNTLQTITVGSASNWSAGTQASLSVDSGTGVAATLDSTDVSIPNVTSAGSAATFEVSQGVLSIIPGAAPSLGTAIAATKINSFVTNIPTAVTFTPNTLPSIDITSTDTSKITTTDTQVIVPVAPQQQSGS